MLSTNEKFEMINARSAHIFETTTCEKCGCVCEAPNTITAIETRKSLLALGFTEAKLPYSELMFCETLDMCVCDACYID